MRRRILISFAVLSLCLSVIFNSAPGADGQPITFTIIAQAPGSGPYGYATSMAKFMKDVLPEGSTVNVVPRGGSMANPTTLNLGQGDVGIAATSSTQWAWDGMPEVYGRHGKHTNIRCVSVGLMTTSYSFVVARKEYVEKTGNDTLEKLLNAAEMPIISIKPPGNIVLPIFRELLKFMGKSLDDYQAAGKLIQVQTSQISEMMRDGRIDAYFECAPVNNPGLTEIAFTTDLVFLPLPEKVIEDMKTIGMFPAVMKAGGYRGLEADYSSTATSNNVIAFKDAPEE
ncbi:MAG: hypothetical protein LBE84_00290, partial [Planctomycetota bacterium]|nr:hypothetical protein [Planctomycetota bacterium]